MAVSSDADELVMRVILRSIDLAYPHANHTCS